MTASRKASVPFEAKAAHGRSHIPVQLKQKGIMKQLAILPRYPFFVRSRRGTTYYIKNSEKTCVSL